MHVQFISCSRGLSTLNLSDLFIGYKNSNRWPIYNHYRIHTEQNHLLLDIQLQVMFEKYSMYIKLVS